MGDIVELEYLQKTKKNPTKNKPTQTLRFII